MYNARWDDRPAEYAASRECWLTRRRTAFVADFLRDARRGDRVLDVGSGVGELVIDLAASRPDLRFTGVEPQPSYVEFAAARAAKRAARNVDFRIGLAESLMPVLGSEEPFDWILSNDLLHHVPDESVVLRAVAEVASPRARWLCIEPNWKNPYVLIGCAVKRGERNFWPQGFLSRAKTAGWEPRNRSFLFLIPPFVKKPPRLLVDLEKSFERYPLLAGGVAIDLARSQPPATDRERAPAG